MPRKLSPAGEAFLKEVLGNSGDTHVDAINTWTPPPEHNHRCNEPPVGNCGPFLRSIFGEVEGNRLRDSINDDAERFMKSRADRSTAQGLQFPSRSREITKEMIDQHRSKEAERQRKYRQRMREAKMRFETQNG